MPMVLYHGGLKGHEWGNEIPAWFEFFFFA